MARPLAVLDDDDEATPPPAPSPELCRCDDPWLVGPVSAKECGALMDGLPYDLGGVIPRSRSVRFKGGGGGGGSNPSGHSCCLAMKQWILRERCTWD